MARPPKKGLDYFPLDCHIDTDLRIVIALFGLSGFAIVIILWQRIYGEEGYYTKWNEDYGRLLALENKVDYDVVSGVIDECIKRGIFDQEKFQKYSVLTSKGIQKRYLTMTEKRTGISIIDDYALLNAPSKLVSAEKTGVSSPKTIVSDGRKYTKESKRKEIKEKETKTLVQSDLENPSAPNTEPVITLTLQDNNDYAVVEDQLKEWQELYQSIDVMQELRKMKGWLNANPTKRKTKKGIKRFINSWLSRSVDKETAVKKSDKQLPGWFYEQEEEPQEQGEVVNDDELMEQLQMLRRYYK